MKTENQNTGGTEGETGLIEVKQVPAGPDSYALVPSHPTPEMLGAFWRTKNTGTTEIGGEHQDSSDVAAYSAMIAAAPAPDPEPVARALDEVAATARSVHADRCRRLAAALRQSSFGGPR